LQRAASLISDGETDGRLVMAGMTQSLIDGGVDEVDYAVVADPESLEIQSEVRRPAILLVAARVGQTRLIDNWLID
jgi:pantoate--beta-alanine ligase